MLLGRWVAFKWPFPPQNPSCVGLETTGKDLPVQRTWTPERSGAKGRQKTPEVCRTLCDELVGSEARGWVRSQPLR